MKEQADDTDADPEERSKEYMLKLSGDAMHNLYGLLTAAVEYEREVITDLGKMEDFQQRIESTLLKKFDDVAQLKEDESGKIYIALNYREVHVLALFSLGRLFEEELYTRKFWEAALKGNFDHQLMVEQGRSLFPHVLECVEAYIEASGKDPYNLHGVFERLSKMGDRQDGAVG
ncbi:hypothetical protein A3D07_01660 [Candidatus Curtissbacteria bacterium RIFCSPHIGHO2_02_FULL_42_15]|uniref:Uncharacterized protein n=1 Tax=Candidatus Curtissbacteria bacterium RIFCSPHIGHO2_02_FULL_42_15 TaxID=1797716 RepID=A0A1F5GFN7_9BACT|nr:MAG: hypothetical protein A3D07_01660 [Candidatus Curtissbacteria bacterium RIFCSPHIGHO2_02_FULL_42_15]